MPSLQRLDQLLEDYYLDTNVHRGIISLAIEPAEIEASLAPVGLNFKSFSKIAGKFWWSCQATSGLYQPGYIATVALQVAAGFRPEDVCLPDDSRITEYLFELAGDPSESKQTNRSYLFYGRENSHARGKTKQEFIWKGVRSRLSRAYGVELPLPPCIERRDRFVQFPKAHMLFREPELAAFAHAYLDRHGIEGVLRAQRVVSKTTQSWPAYRSYFPDTARRRIEKEDFPLKVKLYLAQAERYLARQTEATLECLLERGGADAHAAQSQLRRLRANRNEAEPYYLERDWDGDYELFLEADAEPTPIEREAWTRIVDHHGGRMVFGPDDAIDGVFVYLGPKPRPRDRTAAVVALVGTSGEVALEGFPDFGSYAQANGKLDGLLPDVHAAPRPRLVGGLRLSREASYLHGLGPRIVKTSEGAPVRVRAYFDVDAEYHPRYAPPGMYVAEIGKRRARFSIKAPNEPSAPFEAPVFDLASMRYVSRSPSMEVALFTAAQPPRVDVLSGLKREAITEAPVEVTALSPHAAPPPTVAAIPTAAPHPRRAYPTSSLTPIGATRYDTRVQTWIGNREGALQQMREMLAACYPDAHEEIPTRLYGALAQPSPLVVADAAQVVALAATTGAAITYVSSPIYGPDDLPALHRNVVKHAGKAARRGDGAGGFENPFVFLAVDLSRSAVATASVNAFMTRYALCNGADAQGPLPALPDNLYAAFVLPEEIRAAFRSLPRPHCPLYFLNGGWGAPREGALKDFRPDRRVDPPHRHGAGTNTLNAA